MQTAVPRVGIGAGVEVPCRESQMFGSPPELLSTHCDLWTPTGNSSKLEGAVVARETRGANALVSSEQALFVCPLRTGVLP